MKVILLEDIKGLGRRGDQVKVAAGHARNYLIPNRFALSASGGSVLLTDGAGGVIDYLNYGALAGDHAFGRFPDGQSELRVFPVVTPEAANDVPPSPLILNEYNAVDPTKFLNNLNSDSHLGRVVGNPDRDRLLLPDQSHGTLLLLEWTPNGIETLARQALPARIVSSLQASGPNRWRFQISDGRHLEVHVH